MATTENARVRSEGAALAPPRRLHPGKRLTALPRQRKKRAPSDLKKLAVYAELAHGEDARGEYVERELSSRLSLGLGTQFAERLAGVAAAFDAAVAADQGGAEGAGAAEAAATPAIYVATRQCVRRRRRFAFFGGSADIPALRRSAQDPCRWRRCRGRPRALLQAAD
jgi:hypothetical protein